MEITAAQLAAIVNGEIEGDGSVKISTYSKIEEAQEGSLSFLANPKYTHFVYSTQASVLLVRKDFAPEQPVKPTLVKVDDPYATIASLLNLVKASEPEKVGIEQPVFVADDVVLPEGLYLGAFSYLGKGAKIGKNVKIYPQCYVGDGVTVGDNTVLMPGVKIYHECVIGSNCILHSGVVVGSDGFGFAPQKDGSYMKIAQIGNVVIADNVEIGSNTTVDRATMGSTLVGQGVKLDNLIQVAHNVEIGENTVIAAQTGIAGSAKIGKQNMIGGQVGIAGHIKIGDRNQVGAQSGLHSRIGDGNVLLGYPAVEAREFMREAAYRRRLGEMLSDIRSLKKEIQNLKDNKK